MAVRKYLLGLVAIFGLGFVAEVKGQQHLPFADPLAFDPDFRFFEPMYQADFDDMKARKRANHGWYGAYQRSYVWVSQPEGPLDTGGNFGWGERYDLGYMLENDHGWSFSFSESDGPGAYDSILVQRANHFFDGGTAGPISPLDNDIIVPQFDRNDLQTLERTYDAIFSRNVVEFDSVELNKTWRMDPHHYGGILEPFVGLRYINFTDTGEANYYQESFAPQVFNIPFANAVYETFTEDTQQTSNDLFGGQIGFRYYKFRNRWKFSTDVRMMAMQNYYDVKSARRIEETAYNNPVPINEAALGYANTASVTQFRDDVFSFGLDVRAEAAYQLTRGFSLRVGLEVFDIFQGVTRTGAIPVIGRPAPVPAFSLPAAVEQDIQMVAITFGGTLNL